MDYTEIKVIKNNPKLLGMACLIPDVTFSTFQGTPLKMQIIKPWAVEETKNQTKYPLIVFVQGSAWTFPDVNYQLPQLADLARKGYVVATLTHRNCLEGHPFPAFLEDIKTGIRFLRKNALEYQIDTERIGIWGTSSGGNTALLVGLTENEADYKTEEYKEFSDSVKLVIDCFGPTDLTYIINNITSLEKGMQDIFAGLRGEDNTENLLKLQNINPVNHIQNGKTYPPFLILQGNKDTLVPYDQSKLMYNKLLEAGANVSLVCVEDAPHEGSFWSNELLEIIYDFINQNI